MTPEQLAAIKARWLERPKPGQIWTDDIAHARQDIPDLIAALESAQAEVAERDQRIADQATLIDFCNEMATSIREDWTDPRTECRAIWDAHDMAHVLTGGDRTRSDWGNAGAMASFTADDDERFSKAWPDVRRRMEALIERLNHAGAHV